MVFGPDAPDSPDPDSPDPDAPDADAPEPETPAVDAAVADAAASRSWADRGWWLAVEYGVVAKQDRFEKKLERFRTLGVMKELLEPGGRIVYRNLFRQDRVRDAWTLLAELVPWKAQIHAYVNGEEVSFKQAQDVVWCAGFLKDERPCRGLAPRDKQQEKKGRVWTIGCERRISLAPSGWEPQAAELPRPDDGGEDEVQRRHIYSFTKVDDRGVLVFDREAIAAFVGEDPLARRCPLSPARDPHALAAIFKDVSVRALGWPVVLEMTPPLEKKLGAAVLEAEHGFVLKKGQPELAPHEPVELRALPSGEVEVRRAEETPTPPSRERSIARFVRLPARVEKVLGEGFRLRGVRIEEGYVKLPELDGRYEVEQRFVLSTRFHLGIADDPVKYEGYRVVTVPRPTPEYESWARAVLEEVS